MVDIFDLAPNGVIGNHESVAAAVRNRWRARAIGLLAIAIVATGFRGYDSALDESITGLLVSSVVFLILDPVGQPAPSASVVAQIRHPGDADYGRHL